MAENLPQGNEKFIATPESNSEKIDNVHEKELSKSDLEHGSKEQVTEIASKVESHAKSRSEQSIHSHEKSSKHHPVFHGLREKNLAWSRSMTRTRKKLSISSRAFSKIAHNSVVDSTSEFAGKTIARPSSMVGGALFAFIGSSIILWATKRYGYEYNYLAFILLFVIGSLIGIITEEMIKMIKSSRS